MIATIAGLFLILVPVAFNATFFRLQKTFDYPEILRRPTDEVLRRFHAGGPALRASWYAFAVAALLFLPVPILVHQAFPAAPWYLGIGTTLGIVAGVVQTVGLLRWSFLVPALATRYVDPATSSPARDAIAVVFEAFHRFVGVAVGEHLGYLFTGLWTLIFAAAIVETGIVSPVIGYLGIVPALGILAGLFEEAGFARAAMINAIAYVLWSVWLVAVGIALLF